MSTKRAISVKTAFVVALLAATVTAAPAEPQPASMGWPGNPTAYLGVHIDPVTPELASALKLEGASGAVITNVDQDGPACRAGLKSNDVVIAFNGTKVEGPDQLVELIHATAPGTTVTLTLMRNAQKQDVRVALGSWPRVMAHARAYAMAPPPPAALPAMPEIDMPAFAPLSSHHGLVVETLSPQLSGFFGVPPGRGVLVRSVEVGSPAEAAGLKAGDVIVRVNNEMLHDLADWRRAMRVHASKISVVVVRDKREQTLVINLPAPETSSLDSSQFDANFQAFREEVGDLGPELEESRAQMLAMKPDAKELAEMRQEIAKSMKQQHKELRKMQKEIRKSVPSRKEIEKLREDARQSLPSQQDMEKMRAEVEESAKLIPSQKEIEQMRRDIADSMKSWTPQLQQQMEQLRKEMQQKKLDIQEMMKDFDNDQEF
jgi:serine protease Do